MEALAKYGWWKAMIYQETLSLILTLDDFLISGPHLSSSMKEEDVSDPNIFFLTNQESSSKPVDVISESELTVRTYYVLRPYIRGILYGLNPIYQISLYVPCRDPTKISLYKDIISKIDIGGQFFQDRIYWNYKALRKDIMDSRLACLIYSGNLCLEDDWINRISIESKPFSATLKVDLTRNDHLFDLIEIRSFLEDVHQKYFILINESKNLYFADIIRLHIEEKSRRNSDENGSTNTSGFYSGKNGQLNTNNVTHNFFNQGNSLKSTESKKKFQLFKTYKPLSWETLNTNALLDEYAEIIQEQLQINHEINNESVFKSSFAKTLCRWNIIIQRKSNILKLLMLKDDEENIKEKIVELNSMYITKKCQSENELLTPIPSSQSKISSVSENQDIPNFNKILLGTK